MTMTPAPGPRKSLGGKWLLIGGLGCLGLLLLGGCILAGVLGFLWSRAPTSSVELDEPVQTLPPVDSADRPVAGAPAESVAYTPDRSQLNANLQQKYVPFTFTIPAGWRVVERGDQPDASNFVKVEKQDDTQSTVGNFAVGWMSGAGSLDRDKQLYSTLSDQMEQQFTQGFQNFTKTGAGPVTINGYDGYQLLFRAKVDDNGETIPLCGRMIMISGGNVGQQNGVTLLMLATDKSAITNPADIGASGDYATLLNSFTLVR
ncbi:MAG TPA: hypothetical protein VH253_14760 [Phycisphaerae bacterium]|nr:hypothetical protein [Phycisphaerae bacterium]